LPVASAIPRLRFTLPVEQDQAVPSFAHQAGLDCDAGHIIFPIAGLLCRDVDF
jgi:hypothetical protein